MPSFDVVSKVNMQEVKNAFEQVRKEIDTRYDLKGTKCSVELKEKESQIILIADDNMRLGAIREILKAKLAKRGVSLKSVEFEDAVEAGGDTLRQVTKIKQNLTTEELKRLSKLVKDKKLKVAASIQEDQLRVSGKQRDDLQAMMQVMRTEIQDLDLQFVNMRE